jgi:bacillithiol system protein YtxJ
MKWKPLQSLEQIGEIKVESRKSPVLIFKHSTRCNISRASLDRLERNWSEEEMADVKLYFLDLLSYRKISDQIEAEFGVDHESPQVMVIKNEKSTYDKSHFEIDYHQLKEEIKKVFRS